MNQHQQWLDQVIEDVIDPERPIIDPHHHLWRRPPVYELDELWADTHSGHNIVGTVFIECGAEYRKEATRAMRPLGETEYVADIAAQARQASTRGQPPILGMVCHADLTLGDSVVDVINAHRELAPDLLRGVRYSTAYYPDPPAVDRYAGRKEGVMMDKKFREGFSYLAAQDLSFDAWLLHPQIKELIDLAREFPETTIVFDHFGGPLGIGPYENKQAEVFPHWKRDVAELANNPNVVAKLGGLAMAINGWGWDKRDYPASSDDIVAAHRDYYLHTIDCFGPERCMFESNFPVDKESVSYGVLWNAFKKMAVGFSDSEKNDLFFGTANRVYRLIVP
ncbi:MAG: amidohydrolase [Pseudomonadales bacterium]